MKKARLISFIINEVPGKIIGAFVFSVTLAISLSSIEYALYWAAGALLLSLVPIVRPVAVSLICLGWALTWWEFLGAFIRAVAKPHTVLGYVGVGFVGIAGIFILLYAMALSFGIVLPGENSENEPPDEAKPKENEPGDEAIDSSFFDPYFVLQVSKDASKNEIRDSYRNLVKQYHPDKVAQLGPEIQEVASSKTIQIQKAYEMLSRDL